MTPPLRDRVLFRARTETALRAFFAERDVFEVAVPTLVPNPGLEFHLTAFAVHPIEAHAVADRWLHTSPELAIKAVLGEIDLDVFALPRCYRDEPPGPLHHPEFTMLEWYRRDWDHVALMAETEALVCAMAAAVGCPLPSDETRFRRRTVADVFESSLGIDVLEADRDELYRACVAHGIDAQPEWDRDTLFSVAWAGGAEQQLGDVPTFLTAFPADQAALARVSTDDPRVADRFELYLPGPDGEAWELANAFHELVDAEEQRERFAQEQSARRAIGRPTYAMPEATLHGLGRLSGAAGIALGFERLLCWLAFRRNGWRTVVADWFVAEPLGRSPFR